MTGPDQAQTQTLQGGSVTLRGSGALSTGIPQAKVPSPIASVPSALWADAVPSSSACVSAGPDEEQSWSPSSSVASDGKEIIIVRSNTKICPHMHCCVWNLLGCVLQRLVHAIKLTHIGVLATKARAWAIVCGTGASARSRFALPSPRVLRLGAPISERKTHWWTKFCAVLEKSRVKDMKISSWDPTVVS